MDNKPIPDPTVLTTEQLIREINNLEGRLLGRVQSLSETTQLQFDLISDWRLEQKDDTRVRLDAAFAAQKEAITKQEGATDRQLEQLRITFQNAFDELRRNIEDIKGRMDTQEGHNTGANVEQLLREMKLQIDSNSSNIIAAGSERRGGQAAVVERRQSNAAIYATAAFIISLLFLLGPILTLLVTK